MPAALALPKTICVCCGGPRSKFSAGWCKNCYSKKTRPAAFDKKPFALIQHDAWIEYYAARAQRKKDRELAEIERLERISRRLGATIRAAKVKEDREAYLAELRSSNAAWRAKKRAEDVTAKERARTPSPIALSYPYVSKARGAPDSDLMMVNSLVPQMPGREDICQEIMIALWEKRITLDQIKFNRGNLRTFINAFNKDNFEARGYAVSLDEPMRDGRSWHDVLVDPATADFHS